MEKYKLRFNLSKGENFKKWKLTHPSGHVEYLDRDSFSAVLKDAKFRNHRGTANKIFEGANKAVCSWIEFKSIDILKKPSNVDRSHTKLYYNPKHLPFWTTFVNSGSTKTSVNLDNSSHEEVLVNGTEIFAELITNKL